MKKSIVIVLVLITQFAFSCNCLTYNEAKQKALKENKFIIAQFSNNIVTDKNQNGIFYFKNLSDELNSVFKKYVFLCIPKNSNESYYQKYKIQNQQEMLILDPNGIEIYRLKDDVSNENISFIFNYFSNVDVTYFDKLRKKETFNNLIEIAEWYYSISLDLENVCQKEILNTANQYIKNARNLISPSKKTNWEELQKTNLLDLYYCAYTKNFDLVNNKINLIDEKSIFQNNLSTYYFLINLSKQALNEKDNHIDKNKTSKYYTNQISKILKQNQ